MAARTNGKEIAASSGDLQQQKDLYELMRSEVHELTSRVQLIALERNELERQLSKTQLERLRLLQDSDDRLDDQAQRYEEKITELHSVIAELTKRIDANRPQLIREEDEASQNSGDSPTQMSSNNNNANESCSDNEDDSEQLPSRATEVEVSSSVDLPAPPSSSSNPSKKKEKATAPSSSSRGPSCACETSCPDCQREDGMAVRASLIALDEMTQMRKEVQALQAEGEAQRAQMAAQEAELGKARAAVGNLREERDRLRRKIRELQSRVQSLLTQQGSQGSQSGSPARSKSPLVNPTTGERTPTSREDAPISKIAERVRLKKVESGDRHISGSDIISAGMSNSKVVEHLVRSLQEESNAQEILQSIHSSGSQVSEQRVREFEVETERLNSKVEHLQSQNDLLCLALEESRAQCDRLSVLIGKYESNNTALQLALSCTDHALEASESLRRLHETESQVMALSLAASGITAAGRPSRGALLCDEENDQSMIDAAVALRRSQDTRKAAESSAKRLLQRIDRGFRPSYHGTGSLISPWEDLSSNSHTTSTTSSTSSYGQHEGELSKSEEQRLRDFIRQIQGERAAIRATITELESVHIDPVVREPTSKADAQRLDLENAVLMQELMALKEEKAELKAQFYLLEKERSALELRLSSRDAQEQAYVVQIEHLKNEIRECQQIKDKFKSGEFEMMTRKANNLDPSSGHHHYSSENCEELAHGLMESLQREKKLKVQVQELVNALEKVTKNLEMRHHQSAEFVNDLKRANGALITAFEKSKKKNQSKMKRMEQQMLALIERHTTQVRLLQHKIVSLEEQLTIQSQHGPSETSL